MFECFTICETMQTKRNLKQTLIKWPRADAYVFLTEEFLSLRPARNADISLPIKRKEKKENTTEKMS